MNRWRRLVVALVLAIGAVAAVDASPAAAAAPDATASPVVVAHWNLPAGFFELRPWRNAMWAVRTDDFHSALVERVDPVTNTLATVTELRFASGGFAVGYGSLWIGDWFGNAVWRISPDGAVQARIPTGLGPGDVQVAFGAVWVSDHHGASVTRIDPATDGVTDTVPIGDQTGFRDGPGFLVSDGASLWVITGGSVDHPLAIDPATNRVHDLPPTPDEFCTNPVAAAGLVWSVDPCTATLYGFRRNGVPSVDVRYTAPATPVSFAALGTTAWVGVDRQFDQDTFTGSHGVLEQRDPVSGALQRSVPVGGDVSVLAAGFGSLWAVDLAVGSLRRFDPDAGTTIGSAVR